MRCLLCAIGILCLNSLDSYSQEIMYSHAFSELLSSNNLSFAKPVEGLFKPKMLSSDGLVSYDLVIASDERSTELRFWMDKSFNGTPEMYCFLKASHMAINDDTFDIRIQELPQLDLTERYHADWGAVVSFVPKESLTHHYFAHWISLYKEGQGYINTLILFDDHYIEPKRYRSLFHFNPSDGPPDTSQR